MANPTHKMNVSTYKLLCGRTDNPVLILGHGASLYWSMVDCPECLAKKPQSVKDWEEAHGTDRNNGRET